MVRSTSTVETGVWVGKSSEVALFILIILCCAISLRFFRIDWPRSFILNGGLQLSLSRFCNTTFMSRASYALLVVVFSEPSRLSERRLYYRHWDYQDN